MAGVWGKLAGHGDFVAAGLDADMRAFLVPWLDGCLSGLRADWGDSWVARFDAMAPIAFWIGPALAGGDTPIAGVLAPSRDKVGRRYPIMIIGRGEVAPPMLINTGFHALAEAALSELLAAGVLDSADWPRDLGEATARPPAEVPQDPSMIWARNAQRSGASLLAEVAHFDHGAACAHRACFWTASDQGPGLVLAANSMPDMRGLGWLIKSGQDDLATDSAMASAPVSGTAPVVLVAPEPAPAAGGALLRLQPGQRVNAGTSHASDWDMAPQEAQDRLILRPEWATEGEGG